MNHRLATPISAIVLLLAMTACSTPTTPRIDGLRVSLQLVPGVLVEGGEVDVILTMRNDGRETVQLQGSSSCPPFGLRIIDSVDQPYADPTRQRICTEDLRTWRVEPGESLVHTFRWNGSLQSEGRLLRLAPGMYLLEGIVISPDGGRETSSRVALEVVPGAGTQ
ncbi:MAG: hypothetical protein H0U67_03655 [Gemmatimonadetes bacterium]|nr:hypothetical protein [Gemmatimonadota bacterium]